MSAFQSTAANLQVGMVFQRIRQELGRRNPRGNKIHAVSQGEFGSLLGEQMGIGRILQSTISNWEDGTATIPAAALTAAVQLVDGPFREEILALIQLRLDLTPMAA